MKCGLRETISIAHNVQELCKILAYRADDIIDVTRLLSAEEVGLRTTLQLAEDSIMKAMFRESVRVASELNKLMDLEGLCVEDKDLRK